MMLCQYRVQLITFLLEVCLADLSAAGKGESIHLGPKVPRDSGPTASKVVLLDAGPKTAKGLAGLNFCRTVKGKILGT